MNNSGLGNTYTIQNAIDNTAITVFKLSGMTVGEDVHQQYIKVLEKMVY